MEYEKIKKDIYNVIFVNSSDITPLSINSVLELLFWFIIYSKKILIIFCSIDNILMILLFRLDIIYKLKWSLNIINITYNLEGKDD